MAAGNNLANLSKGKRIFHSMYNIKGLDNLASYEKEFRCLVKLSSRLMGDNTPKAVPKVCFVDAFVYGSLKSVKAALKCSAICSVFDSFMYNQERTILEC